MQPVRLRQHFPSPGMDFYGHAGPAAVNGAQVAAVPRGMHETLDLLDGRKRGLNTRQGFLAGAGAGIDGDHRAHPDA